MTAGWAGICWIECPAQDNLSCHGLAHRKWNYVDRVPEIELPKGPKWRTRYLSEDEIKRLLAACPRSKNKHPPSIVALAINSGMLKNEILRLAWERIDQDHVV